MPPYTEEERQRRAQQAYYMGIIDDVYMSIRDAVGIMGQRGLVEPYKAYRQEMESGLETMKEVMRPHRPQATDVLKFIGGAAQYTLSPITGGARGFAGDPTREIATELGAPPGAAEFAGRMAEEAVQFFPLAQVAKAKLAGRTASILAPEEIVAIERGVARATSRGRRATSGIPPQAYSADDYLQTGLKSRLVKDIADASEASLRGNMDESKRLFENIKDLIELDEISLESIPEILQKNNMTPVEFAQKFAQTVSESGRTLAHLSHLQKRLNHIFKGEPLALQYLNEAFEVAPRSLVDDLYKGWRWIENKRRAMLVTQVATTMRNISSQAGRLGLSSIDEGFQAALRHTFGGGRISVSDGLNEARHGLNNIQALMGRMSPKGRKRLMQVLDQEQGAIQKARLIDTTVHEAVTGKFTRVLNTLNKTQEHFFRRIAFEAKMRELLKRSGTSWETVDPKLIPQDFYEKAVNYAMEMTFAANPKSKAAQEFISAWNKVGLTTVNPFPRFAFGNALPFVLEHSPLGFLSTFRPSVIKKLAAGNPDEFAKLASRGMIGTLMLDSASRIRQSEYAGDKWYEIKIGEDEEGNPKVIDTRAFAPFSTYLFLAEAITNPDKLKFKDYAEAAVGLNRIAGSGLVLIDMLRAKYPEQTTKQLRTFIGQYLAGFAVPFRTASDILGGVDQDELIRRDIRGDEPHHRFLFPFLVNIPKLSQVLPEKPMPYSTETPMKTEPIDLFGREVPGSWWRQLTGLHVRTKRAMEAEADRIALDYTVMFPRTGIPEADREIMKRMAPIIEQALPGVLKNPNYKSKPSVVQRIIMTELFRAAKESARKQLMVDRSDLTLEIQIGNLPRDYRRLLTEMTGEDWETVEGIRKLIRTRFGQQ